MAMHDDEIVRLFWERREEALRETQEKYGRYCQGIAKNILENDQDAEECTNDALLKAWESIPPEKPASLKAYLGRITRNLSFNLYRKAHANKRGGGAFTAVLDELAECVAGGVEPEEEWAKKELAEAINDYLAGLSKDRRQLFAARYFYADEIPVIAKRFGIRENTASVRLARLRKGLREYLTERGFHL